MQATYLKSAQKAHQLPEFGLPEIGFLGRSNSGKSSLINALVNQKGLARTSSTPGRTQMANFFGLKLGQGKELILADLPGYGYNKAPQDIRNLWDELLATYLDRGTICEFLFICDLRRDLDDFELEFLDALSSRTRLSIVLTKADKLSRAAALERKRKIEAVLKEIPIRVHAYYIVSSLRKSGLDELREAIFGYATLAAEAEGLGSATESAFKEDISAMKKKMR